MSQSRKHMSQSRKHMSQSRKHKTTSTNFSSTRSLRVRAVQGKIQKLSDAASKHVCPWVSARSRAPKGFQHKIVSSCFGPRRVLFNTTFFSESNEVEKNPALENFQKSTLTPILEEDEASSVEPTTRVGRLTVFYRKKQTNSFLCKKTCFLCFLLFFIIFWRENTFVSKNFN